MELGPAPPTASPGVFWEYPHTLSPSCQNPLAVAASNLSGGNELHDFTSMSLPSSRVRSSPPPRLWVPSPEPQLTLECGAAPSLTYTFTSELIA